MPFGLLMISGFQSLPLLPRDRAESQLLSLRLYLFLSSGRKEEIPLQLWGQAGPRLFPLQLGSQAGKQEVM